MSSQAWRAPLSVSIKWSLLAAILFLLSVLATVSGVATWELASLRGAVANVGRVRLPQVQELGEFELSATRIRLSAVRLASSNAPERRAETAALLDKRLTEFAERLEAHRRAIASDAGEALMFQQFLDKWRLYLAVQDELLKTDALDRGALDQLVNVVSFAAFNDVIAAIETDIGFARMRAEEAVTQTEAASRRFSWALVVVNFVSAAVGAATLAFVVREVSAPIRRMTEAMRSIARGRLETAIPFADRANELGEMAKALAVFRKSLVENERLYQATRTLSELSEWLQSAKTEGELYGMISNVLAGLIPECRGTLFAYGPASDRLEVAATWNGSADADAISSDDCWSLRRGHAYRFGGNAVEFVCVHCAEAAPGDYCCIPILAHGKAVGMLHLAYAYDGAETQEERRARFADRTRLGMACAEHISVAMANARLREELRDQTTRDPLTGLTNRRGLEAAAARLDANGAPGALVLIDVDHFKRFNDTHGHDAGDAVLRAVTRAMARVCEGVALPCRFGGEEFVALLGNAGPDEAAALAERLRAEVEATPVKHLGAELPRVTISLGVAAFPGHAADFEAALKLADEALYAAKSRGRNRVALAGDAKPLAALAERAA